MAFPVLPRLLSRPAWVAAALGAALSLPARAAEAPDVEAPEIGTPAADSAQAPAAPATTPAPAPASVPQPGQDAKAAPQGNAPATPAAAAHVDSAKTPVAGSAAPEIEIPSNDKDITVEVDPRQSRNQDRSLGLAMLYSAVLPGTGELYLREKPNAKAFLLAEAGFWASLYVAFMARESYLTSARNYASDYAGIDASGKSSAFLENMANYRSYLEKQHRQDSYELAQILSGKRTGDYDIKPAEANYWDFGSSANPENTRHWNSFQSSLRYYRASKVAISFAVGALALNRLASLANTLRVYKHTSAKSLGLNLTPEIGLESVGSQLTLRF
ncbi:MAG: hypothetical protein JF616_13960 [Fibrobacteres bacterium]|jgi:hypothetical protein|nr:hypothetical protein [Fibrobacterota bacterium]